MGFFEDDDEALTTSGQEIVHEARAMADFQQIENDLLEKSSQILGAVMNFDQIDPSQTEPPWEWVEQMGEREAQRLFRLAQAGWMPKKDAPYGAQVAEKAYDVISRSKSKINAPKQATNVQIIQLPDVPQKKSEEVYGVLDVVEDSDG